MKTITIFVCIVCLSILATWFLKYNKSNNIPHNNLPFGLKVVIIDGCQYFKSYTYQQNFVYSHKGNCFNKIHYRENMHD